MRHKLITLAALALILAACRAESPFVEDSKKKDAAKNQPAAQGTAKPGATGEKPADPSEIEITQDNGSKVAVFRDLGQGKVEIAFANGTKVLRGEPRDTGKRKYRAGDDPVELEVKPDDKGFKVRNDDGSLRWKVRFSDTGDKIKISDNEASQNAYELKIRAGDDRVKVVAPGEKELGNVRFYRNETRSKVKNAADADLFKIKGPHYSAGWGVLLMDRIPENDRYVIIAELLSRQK
ncbi:MAG TPA: hypothetical protein VGF69_10845 [Thermoanaerobaculia bacterium]|jgi:hypothetical protein